MQVATVAHAALFKFLIMAFLRVWPVRESVRCKRRVASAIKLKARAGTILRAGRAIAVQIYTRRRESVTTIEGASLIVAVER